MKYGEYYYCPYCLVWIPASSPEVITKNGRLIHAICGRKLRTRPRKPVAQRWKQYPRVNPAKLVTPVTGGRP